MTKFYVFRLQIVMMMIILISVCAVAQAQTPSAGELPVDQPTQTLMQEEAPPEASLSESNPVEAASPELNTPAAASPTDPADANAAAPSLADYLNNAGVAQQGGAAFDSGASNSIPALDASALQGGTSQQESQEALREKAKAAMRQDAFKVLTDRMMPLKPSEIRRVLELYDETKQASEIPVYPTPEPESSFQTASLEPGSKPIVVKTAVGNVTTLSIVDITGQPWPIQDLTWAGDFQIEQPDNGGHMLRITPTSEFANGNVSMRLVGLNPPVIFTLKAERKAVHVRLDVQIPEVGPKGVLPPMNIPVSTKAGDDFMTSVLVGVVKGANTSQLKVDGIDGRTTAYSQGNMIYLRTPYTMLSPAWTSSVQSADGMKVYALNFTPVILLSDKGKMLRAYVSHKERSDEQY